MHGVAVERGQILVGASIHEAEQIGAQRHQRAGAARRAVQPPDQFLAPRFGRKMQVAGVLVGWLRAPGLDRLRQPFAVRAIAARQRFEKRQPAGVVEMAIAVEHLTRDDNAGSLAAARQQRLAQFDQFGGILFRIRRPAAAKQGAAALGNRGEKVGKEGVAAHGGRSGPDWMGILHEI
jgi:hypothetical protein